MLGAYGLNILVGLVLSTLIGVLAYRRRALTRSGVGGAILTGTLIFGFGGWEWGLLLIAFFISSSSLTFYRQSTKAEAAEQFAKGGMRDLWQALANGGLAAVLAVGNGLYPHPAWFFAFVGALAEANADTWGTELGLLSEELPRMITTQRLAVPGTSGAVTWDGTGATLLGAGLLSILGAFLHWSANAAVDIAWALASVCTLTGFVGALVDSLLGATVQGIYYCEECRKQTEKPLHRCGNPARPLRGWRWLNNDWVNFISTLVSALIAGGMGMLYV